MSNRENSGETLRRAAALMRGRAEAAIRDSEGVSVWQLGPPDYYGNTPTVQVVSPPDPEPFTVAAGCTDADAEHIASWHPAVALAVADWLDATALLSESQSRPLQYDGNAMTVARAYLGEDA